MQFHLKLPGAVPSARMGRDALMSTLAQLIASGEAGSKADLARATGLSRTMVEPAVTSLVELGLVRPTGFRDSPGRGRPGDLLALSADYGLILVADCGYAHCTLAVFDLTQRLLASEEVEISITDDPETRLFDLASRLLAMVERLGMSDIPRRMILGSTGFVDRVKGEVFPPARSAASSWDGYPVVDFLAGVIDGPVHLEHDVALRALGEALTEPTSRGPLAYIKVSSGIGLAMVSPSGELQVGADGFAGQIAHVRVTDDLIACTCGNTGCLNAVASMLALADSFAIDTTSSTWYNELLALIKNQDPQAIRSVKRSGEYIGQAVVDLIHLINPERVIIGGNLAMNSDHLLAGIRSVVYNLGLPVSTRSLTVDAPLLGANSGIVGGLAVGMINELSAESIRRRIDARMPVEERPAS